MAESKKGLLFINGEAPEKLPDFLGYDVIGCTDGAVSYLRKRSFPVDRLDFVSGDFDLGLDLIPLEWRNKVIHTPDQEFTDFHKALEILLKEGVSQVDVYGGSGGEMDHFLGNLHTAYLFKSKLSLVFYDKFAKYHFIPNRYKISGVKGRMISLFPFPSAEKVSTLGLNWPLKGENLSMHERIGTRNFALNDTIEVSYSRGDLLLFIGNPYHQEELL